MMTRAVAIAMIALSLLAAACGSGDVQQPVGTRSAGPITTTSPPPLDGTVLPVGQEFWHSGFRVELTEAEVFTSRTFIGGRTSYWLKLSGNFENQGRVPAAFDPAIAVEAAGQSYSTLRDKPPQARPGDSAPGYITILIAEDLDLHSADLVVGAAGESQARVPLGSSGAAVRLAPTDVALEGRLTTELFDFDFAGASLRHDIPALYEQVEPGQMALTLHFAVTSRMEAEEEIIPDDLALELPDGSVVAPVAAELGLLPPDPDDATPPEPFVSFVVDEMATGQFTLRLTFDDSSETEDTVTEATFEFVL